MPIGSKSREEVLAKEIFTSAFALPPYEQNAAEAQKRDRCWLGNGDGRDIQQE